jgi:CO/xanthine dehydrogenase FAD-binding subunit
MGLQDVDRAAAVAAAAAYDVDAIGDVHGTSDYRRHLARTLTQRAVRRAATRAAS